MRTKTLTLYSASELKEQFPEAFERALRDWRDDNNEIFWKGELFDSLKATIKATGYRLEDYSLQASGYGSSGIRLNERDCDDLEGARALRWLENVVLSPLRIKPGHAKWKEYLKYGDGYRTGQVKTGPFTGVCYDDDFLQDLRDSLKSGSTVRDAVRGLGDKYGELLQAELDDQQSEKYFLGHAYANDLDFDEDGRMQ